MSRFAPPARSVVHYEVIAVLKNAEGVETLKGRDLRTGADVVVKLTRASPAAERRLEHETRVLAGVCEACCAPPFELGRSDEVLYQVRRFVPGVTLAERLNAGRASVIETLAVGRGLLRAIAEAHRRGILHRGIRPANVVVSETGPIEKAVLIDFGVSRVPWSDGTLAHGALSAARYLSPEQAGLLEADVDARSDLYAVGATLYECLAGRPAFDARSVSGVLRQHLAEPPPRLGGGVPPPLDDLLQRLLAVDPRERFPDVAAALHELERIGAALDAGVDLAAAAPHPLPHPRALRPPALAGRRRELEALDRELAAATGGRGGLTLLAAPSGAGKTRVLDELAARAGMRGAWVLRGRPEHQAPLQPLEALRGAVAELVSACADVELARRLRARLGVHLEVVCTLLPELAALLGGGREPGSEEHGEPRALRAIAALLDALGTAERPAVVALDDFQWADELTIKALCEWQRRSDGQHVLLVAAYRDDEPPERLPAATLTLALPPLDAGDVRRLVESMAGALPDAAVDVIVEHAAGNPFAAMATLAGMIEEGALLDTAEGWRADPAALATAPLSRQAAELLSHRIERLPPRTAQLLSAGAVLGHEFELDLAAELTGCSSLEAEGALVEAAHRQFVWIRPGSRRAMFTHDKLRDAVLARLAPAERRRLHHLAATGIEARNPTGVVELAHHWDSAGDPRRALPWALAAAEQARARHALDTAARYYAIAEAGAEASPRAERLSIFEAAAQVQALRGRYVEAEEGYVRARALAQGRLELARIDGKLGDLAVRRGDHELGSRRIEGALRMLDRSVPGGRAALVLQLLWEVLVQVLHTAFPAQFLARRAARPEDLLAARLYDRVALVYWLTRGPLALLWAHLRHLNLLERGEPSPELGKAWAAHAWTMSVARPRHPRALAYAEKGLEVARQMSDLWLEGYALSCKGVALSAASRLAEARDATLQAARLMERVGDRFEENAAWFFHCEALYRLGELKQMGERARALHARASREADAHSLATFSCYWAMAYEGRHPRPERLPMPPPENVVQQLCLLRAEALYALDDGSVERSAALIAQAYAVARRGGLRGDPVAKLPLALATGLRQQAEACSPAAPAARRALLARARRHAREGLRLAQGFRNNLPHALREVALLEATAGRPAKARRLLDESLAVALAQGARFEHAQSLAARGRVGGALGWPEASGDRAAAEAALAALRPEARDDPGATLSLADRFATLLEVGRKIVSALTRDAVFDASREAAVTLLRAERCTLVPASDAREGSGLAQRALASSRPLIDAGVICARIMERGRPIACLEAIVGAYGRLGEQEVRLLEYVATLAGAALENAAGFADNERARLEIRRLSEAVMRGQEDERRRLALALHDGAGQTLTALGLRLETAAKGAPASEAVALGGMRALVEQVLDELRGLAHGLRPAVLDRFGLAAALEDLAQSLSGPSLSVSCTVDPPVFPSLSDEVVVQVFRIAQSALGNVVRHASAKAARLDLRVTANGVRFEVEDDGVGFDSSAQGDGRGIGLMGMRERAGWLGGTFALDTAPGRGTRVVIVVPAARGGVERDP